MLATRTVMLKVLAGCALAVTCSSLEHAVKMLTQPRQVCFQQFTTPRKPTKQNDGFPLAFWLARDGLDRSWIRPPTWDRLCVKLKPQRASYLGDGTRMGDTASSVVVKCAWSVW